ncbi:PREDICTED: protein regulator of cytokinesis 1-like [Acropora digitifera]|uniref:protein regulator of cytokinesis 1-like n=1 Tax=Acropora digitifera TaxID=70779 RepID=UPI00077AE1B7|nr:PREDICTED: protein regulator of cytokinesis 1-like [Acropora digitifera]
MENESSSKNQSRHLSTSAVEESMQMIKNEVYQCIQNSMETLHSIWSEIGLQEDQKKDRTETVLYHLQHLFQEMVKEEKELKSTLLANVETCTKELEILSQELQVPVYKPETQMTILMLENDLRTKVDALKLEKHDRLKNLKSLRERESEFCDRMCLSPHNLGDVNVPTMEQLKELEANVLFLHKELAKRQNSLRELKHEITRLWEDLEMEPSTMIGQEMAKADAETTFKLSSENLAKLKDLHQELENQEKRNAQEALELRESIKSLYDKLEVDQPEREDFFSKNTGHKPSVICKSLDLCRKELSELWDKCFFGPSQREEFAPAFDNNHTEELLAIHEHQVEVMKNYYEENKVIFKLVEKREALFRTMEEFEMKKNDTNRLANRGGALLKEEKIRKGINKELPKIEQKLKTEVGKWEEEHERTFLINGYHYMDIITNQWAAFNAQKEQEKLERHKRQQEIMEKEMVFGSKPASTPKKRCLLDNHTEELLAIHEHQVEVMKNYYEENKTIFKLVEKRETLFRTMEEFEMKKNDTNRLANRGGALLKEEKIRKGISKELPKIEQKLKTEVGKWEEEHERTFLINGCHYMDIITNQWAAFNAQKEQEKLERHKRQQEIMEKEMVFGSKPASTPKKRTGNTPLRTPKRMRMQDGMTTSTPSKFPLHSSVCPSPRPTPASASGKSAGRPPAFTKPSFRKVANVVKKKAERRLSGRLAGKRRVLGEKNGNTSKQDLISNASIQVVHSSKSSTARDETLVACTSYNEFANGLATDENHLRSSILNKTHSVMSFV